MAEAGKNKNLESQVLQEIRTIRNLLPEMLGTEELPEDQKFNIQSIQEAAKEYRSLSIKRGKWIDSGDIGKYIKGATYDAGKFIVEHFGFNNFFIRGKTRYFNKKDLVALAKELKARNVDLKRYMELLHDQEKFKRYVKSAEKNKGKNARFIIPDSLSDITTKPYKPPTDEILKHIDLLKKEFETTDLSEYIDLYQYGNYAMFKHEYYWDRYLKPEIKKRCNKWINEFNYANHALKKARGEG